MAVEVPAWCMMGKKNCNASWIDAPNPAQKGGARDFSKPGSLLHAPVSSSHRLEWEAIPECLSIDSKLYDSRPPAPCLPDNVVATLDCSANSFAVTWCASEGGSVTYIAMAIGSDGSRVSCETDAGTACTIQPLTCGLNYSVVVTTTSVDCGEIEGSDYFVMSGNGDLAFVSIRQF